ncbi:MAG TPA: CoA transferase, partial [Acidimicrobiales bacterium]
MAESVAPLSHLKVLDMSRLMPGGYCTLLLADLGAQVVKVEAPGKGDGLRPMKPGAPTEAMHMA